jgi:hypothetical protein
MDKRAQNFHVASTCETASSSASSCQCRCNGALHGALRVTSGNPSDYEALPAGDPHHIPTPVELKAERKLKRRGRRASRRLFLRDAERAALDARRAERRALAVSITITKCPNCPMEFAGAPGSLCRFCSPAAEVAAA